MKTGVEGAGMAAMASREAMARRVILTSAVAAVSSFLAWHAQASIVNQTDFTQLWHAARGWLGGRNPYDVVGPQATFRWPFPLLYPFTAVLATVPFAWLPLRAASAGFVGLGSGALAWTVAGDARRASAGWWVFASACFIYVIRTAQWSPLLTAAALSPASGWLLVCKPSLGLALFAAYPRWRTLALGALFTAVAVALLPTWPRNWLATLPSAYHMSAPVTYVTAGGPLILLALSRWRRPEARLLVALGCIPHTTMLYEALPLFLVPRRWQEGAVLSLLSWACMYRHVLPDYLQMMHTMAWRMTLLLYLPCLVMVLMRDNQSPTDTAAAPVGGA